MSLTQNGIERLLAQDHSEPIYVQLVAIRSISGKARLTLSDGVLYHPGITSSVNVDETTGVLVYDVVSIDEWLVNIQPTRQVIVVIKMTSIAHQGGVLGSPISYAQFQQQQQGQAPPAPQQPQQLPHQQQQQQQPPQHQQQPPPNVNPYQAKQQQPPYQQQQNGFQQQHHQQQQLQHEPHQQQQPFQQQQQRPPYQPQQQQFGARPGGPGGPGQASRPASSFVDRPQIGQQHFHQISSLNQYQNKWTIKARVTSKSAMREWQNERGSGKIFSVDLLDEHGGQIKCTMFKEAAEKMFPLFQVDRVYTISRGTLKPANKRFNRLPHDFEITLGSDAEVQLVDDDRRIQTQHFEFVPIDQMANAQVDAFVDVLGVVLHVGEEQQLRSSKTNKDLIKRSVFIGDNTLTSIELTMWGEMAQKYDEALLAGNPVVAVKTCRISEFGGGRSLNTSFDSQIFTDLDRKDAHHLKEWWNHQGRDAMFNSLSSRRGGGGGSEARKTFSAIKDENLGFGEKPDYFSVRGTVLFIKNDLEKPPWYLACPNESCNKKVNPEIDGNRCEKCNQVYDRPKPRYILSFLCSDSTGSCWLTAFNECAEIILRGQTASTLADIKDHNPEAFKNAIQESNFGSFIFSIRAKSEQQRDENRVRCHVRTVVPVNYRQESLSLLEEIAKLELL